MKKNGSVKQIQEYTKNHFGYYAKTCWIADVKSQCGIYVKPAWNRKDKYNREVPCRDCEVLSVNSVGCGKKF